MKKHNSTNFRRNMSKTFDQCEESSEPVLITTRKDGRDEPQQMVIITKAQYDMISMSRFEAATLKAELERLQAKVYELNKQINEAK